MNTNKKKLINEPMLLQPRLHEHQEKYQDKSSHVRFVHSKVQQTTQDENPGKYNRSQSEGHRLIQHIEESLESVNQYIKLSDTSQSSLQNTLQMNLQQHFASNSKQPVLGMTFSPSPNHQEESASKFFVKAPTSKLIDEQAQNHERDRFMWEQDKLNIENRLEEALMINTKLFEKVKRMETQIRDMLCNNQDAAAPLTSA